MFFRYDDIQMNVIKGEIPEIWPPKGQAGNSTESNIFVIVIENTQVEFYLKLYRARK